MGTFKPHLTKQGKDVKQRDIAIRINKMKATSTQQHQQLHTRTTMQIKSQDNITPARNPFPFPTPTEKKHKQSNNKRINYNSNKAMVGAILPWNHKPMSLSGRLGNSEIGGCKEIHQPFANPSPTPRQPLANPSPTLRQPFANPLPTFSANPSPTPSFRGPQAPV